MAVAQQSNVIQLPKNLTPPAVDEPQGQIAFRLCKMMLSRKVLWDEDVGFDIPQFATALGADSTVVAEVLHCLEREGWIVRAEDGERPILTDYGVASLLGRGNSVATLSAGEERSPAVAGGTAFASAEDSLG